MGNWSELTEDIVYQVLELLHSLEDFVRFAAVCKPWRSIAHCQKTSVIPFAPWLMLSKKSNSNRSIEDGNNIKSFFSLSRKQIFNHQLPQAHGRRCCGSPYGWLVTLGPDLNIHLLNPLSKIQISLPPHPELQAGSKLETSPSEIFESCTSKFVLASSPSFWNTPTAQRSLVFAIYGVFKWLAYTTPGNAAWTCVADAECTHDVIFFNDKIYTVDIIGVLWVCEVNTSRPKMIQSAQPLERFNPYKKNRFYLLEISDELHLVQRVFRIANGSGANNHMVEHFETYGFNVYKFEFGRKKWNQLNDLGDLALFLGDNTSFSLSTSIYTELEGSSIYFSDDHRACYPGDQRGACSSGVCDMGVFDYNKGTVMPFPVHTSAGSQFYRPLFFLPSL